MDKCFDCKQKLSEGCQGCDGQKNYVKQENIEPALKLYTDDSG